MTNLMKKNGYSAILRLFGWQIIGNFPAGHSKSLCIMVPHTSGWDFVIGIMVRGSIGMNIRFVAKHNLFKFPLGGIMRALGGYPVNRQASSNFVFSIVEIINKESAFHLGIAPEGTRKKVSKLKTGFYYIAQKAKVPLFLVKFDFEHKTIDFGEPFWVTGDMEKDFEYIRQYYKGVKGKVPAFSYGVD